MVILIGGASHAGKTLLAQRLLERYGWPYTSLDHIKMGLIRGYPDCGFTALDGDEVISGKLWGMVRGMAQVCVENGQNHIFEGCYLPPERVAELPQKDVIPVYILLSPKYIERHFDDILRYENSIERRKCPHSVTAEELMEENRALRSRCARAGLRIVEIQRDYECEIQAVYTYLDHQIQN